MKQKIKTHKASKKRFHLTPQKKLMHFYQGDNSHLKANKNRAQKARKKGQAALSKKNQKKRIIKLLNH